MTRREAIADDVRHRCYPPAVPRFGNHTTIPCETCTKILSPVRHIRHCGAASRAGVPVCCVGALSCVQDSAIRWRPPSKCRDTTTRKGTPLSRPSNSQQLQGFCGRSRRLRTSHRSPAAMSARQNAGSQANTSRRQSSSLQSSSRSPSAVSRRGEFPLGQRAARVSERWPAAGDG